MKRFLQKILFAITFVIFVLPVAHADDFYCPEYSSEPTFGALFELGGLSYDFDGDGEISSDECFALRAYNGVGEAEDIEDLINDIIVRNDIDENSIEYMLFNQLFLPLSEMEETYDPTEYLNSGDNLMSISYCRYDETSGNYDAVCTPALVSCSGSDNDQYIISLTANAIALALNGSDMSEVSEYFLRGYIDAVIQFLLAATGEEIPEEYRDMLFQELLSEIFIVPDPSAAADPENNDEPISIQGCGDSSQIVITPPGKTCEAGEYLYRPMDAGYRCQPCEPGYYCPDESVTYEYEEYSGLYETCCEEIPYDNQYQLGKALCPSDRPYSPTGAEGISACNVGVIVNLYQNESDNDNAVNDSIRAYNENPMPTTNTSGTTLTAPTRDGYIFTGYWSARSGGTKYYNSNMTSANYWDSDSGGVLYAQWTRINTVTLYQNESDNDNTVNATVTVSTGSAMPTTNTSGTTLTVPTRDGYVFTGYWSARSGGIKYYDSNMKSAHVWDSNSDGSLYAHWVEYEPFVVTTTNLSDGDQVGFLLQVQGTFNVDCGNGGTLSGSGVSGNTLIKNNFNYTFYYCSYSTGGVKQIRFTRVGMPIAYRYYAGYGSYTPTISFSDGTLFQNSVHKIASLSGSLSQLFPVLDSIPSGIYPNPTTVPNFYFAFYNATNLTSVSHNLFGTYSGSLSGDMFTSTFMGATKLKDFTYPDGSTVNYVPPEFFGELSGSGYYMSNIFYNNNAIASSCPANTYKNITGFESYWNGRVSCNVCPSGTTSPAGSTSVSQCVAAQSCPANYHVPANHPEMCFSSVLHLDDTRPNDIVYLKDAATTSPALNIDIDDDGVNDGFANLTTTRTVMTDTSSHYLTVPVNGVTYYVCDDTSCPQ